MRTNDVMQKDDSNSIEPLAVVETIFQYVVFVVRLLLFLFFWYLLVFTIIFIPYDHTSAYLYVLYGPLGDEYVREECK